MEALARVVRPCPRGSRTEFVGGWLEPLKVSEVLAPRTLVHREGTPFAQVGTSENAFG